MRKTDSFKQYIWLVNTIERHGKITLERLSRLWVDNDLNEGKPLARTTFFRLKLAIEEMFGIRIECDTRNGYQYYIACELSIAVASPPTTIISFAPENDVVVTFSTALFALGV